MIFQINERVTVSPLSSAAFHLLSFYFSPPSVSVTPGLWLRPPEVDLTTRHIDTNIKPGKINRFILGPSVCLFWPLMAPVTAPTQLLHSHLDINQLSVSVQSQI